MMRQKKERKFELHLNEDKTADLSNVWREVLNRIKRGENHERK